MVNFTLDLICSYKQMFCVSMVIISVSTISMFVSLLATELLQVNNNNYLVYSDVPRQTSQLSTYKEAANWCKSNVSLEDIEGPLTHACIMNIISKATYLEGL